MRRTERKGGHVGHGPAGPEAKMEREGAEDEEPGGYRLAPAQTHAVRQEDERACIDDGERESNCILR